MYGVRNFDSSSEWEQTDHQNVVGTQVHFAGPNGFGPEIGVTYSQDTSHDSMFVNRPVDDVTTSVTEVFVGLRKNHMLTDSFQLSLSGGMSAFYLDTDVDLSYLRDNDHYSDDGGGYAPYLQGGANYYVTEEFTIGIMYRHHFVDEETDIFLTQPDLDGDMVMVTMGWSF
jgi:hypothetical protein